MAPNKSPEEIFNEAVEISDSAKQADYLDEACAGDEKLRAEVEALLKWDREAGSFLDIPDDDQNVIIETSASSERSGTVIGRYKLLEKVGEGGMATVYMAEQKHPICRRVALKLIKLGMDTKQVIARFEAERQALAMMDHPNIAKVFDAGTTDTGRPYFVMELVRGLPITEFCDSNHLTTRERLDLFISVCQAVQHAHQRGVIHRDIKPSNVLVTLHDGQPVPKVIDFGIAKAVNQQLTEKTVFTRYSQMIGTPEYMSPEQAEMSGLDIDTRTDVFSLGVLLYELLTGTTPFDLEYLLSKGYSEMQRIIREEEPTRPSTKVSTLGEALTDVAKQRQTSPELLCKLIRTDLDWIVMKTLEKDRNQRYESVSELVADVKRHLNNEPILAGRPSTVYRIRKFIQRRHTLVMSVTAVAAAVVAGFIISTTLYIKVRRSHQRETAALAEAKSVIEFFTDDFLASVFPERAKSQQVTVRYLIEAASEKLKNRFEDNPRVEAEIREILGQTYFKLGDYDAAEPHLKRVLELRKTNMGEDDPATLNTLRDLGNLFARRGQYEDGEPLLLEALEKQSRILGKEHEDTLLSMYFLTWLYMDWGRFDKGGPLAEENLKLCLQSLGEEHPVTLFAMGNCGWLHILRESTENAEPLLEKGYEISLSLYGQEHEYTLRSMIMLVTLYEKQGRIAESTQMAAQALDISRRVLGKEHGVTSTLMNQLGTLYTMQKRYKEAEPLLIKSVEINRNLVEKGHSTTMHFMRNLARLYDMQAEYEKAIVAYEEVLQLYPDYAYAHDRLAHLLATCEDEKLKDCAQAISHATKACELTDWQNAAYLTTLAMAHAVSGDFQKAVTYQKQAIDVYRKEEGEDIPPDYKTKLRLYESGQNQ